MESVSVSLPVYHMSHSSPEHMIFCLDLGNMSLKCADSDIITMGLLRTVLKPAFLVLDVEIPNSQSKCDFSPTLTPKIRE